MNTEKVDIVGLHYMASLFPSLHILPDREHLVPLPIRRLYICPFNYFRSPLSYKCTLIFDLMMNLYIYNAYITLFYFNS